MRSLVIYDTLMGHTEQVARAIAEGLAERGSSEALPVHVVGAGEIAEAGLMVVGGPTHLKGASRPLLAFLRNPFRRHLWVRRPVATFDTRFWGDPAETGSAAVELARRLRHAGAIVIVPPESFFVEDYKGPLRAGELSRAVLWGRSLHLGDRLSVVGD
jgi:menaquinone-dependent protoporphyrinogen IX oxidase